jgi:hypothetical protein
MVSCATLDNGEIESNICTIMDDEYRVKKCKEFRIKKGFEV